jgi:hypothetical protein
MCGVSRAEGGLDVSKGELIETIIVACVRFDPMDREENGPRDEPYREEEPGH